MLSHSNQRFVVVVVVVVVVAVVVVCVCVCVCVCVKKPNLFRISIDLISES